MDNGGALISNGSSNESRWQRDLRSVFGYRDLVEWFNDNISRKLGTKNKI